MLTTRVCHITEHLDAIWPLLEAHRRELATHPDLMALKPQVETYRALEKRGQLLSIVLEHQHEGIVGYSVNLISRNLHYSDLLTCQNDVIYVSPSYREEGGGRMLLEATEVNARDLGCGMVLMHAKPDTRLDAVLPTRGYAVQDVIWSRVL